MKNIFTLILILTALNVQLQSQTWENTNVILKNPNSYPYGFNINLTYATGNWAREYSFSHSGTGKLFSIGALGSGHQLSYGYIGGNSTNHVVYDTPWMVFKSDGKVGIGTKDPKGNLHVQNTNLSAIDIQRHTDNSHWRISTGNFGTDALFIHPVLNNENIV
ncbi:MAG: hypothetical protein MI922_22055, partial [Bacteroidales bacterium]|nr:hypothetical protein [Bacteroidales bacterium]